MRTLAQQTRLEFAPSNVMPVWFLPFWRLVKGEAEGSFHAAFVALPVHLPRGVRCPTAEELAIVLVDHGLC